MNLAGIWLSYRRVSPRPRMYEKYKTPALQKTPAFEACVALKSLKLDRIFNSFEIDFWSFSKVSEILALYSGNRSSSLSHQWKLSEAHVLIELHKNVKFFAKAFVSSALYINPIGMRLTRPEAQPSPAEIHRIQRMFYRFEIYCNLFRRRERYVHNKLYDTYSAEGRLPLEERQAIFFDRFPPWENEQLACIRDYIQDRISVRKHYQYLCLYQAYLNSVQRTAMSCRTTLSGLNMGGTDTITLMTGIVLKTLEKNSSYLTAQTTSTDSSKQNRSLKDVC